MAALFVPERPGWARCSREAQWLPARSRGSTRAQPLVEPVSAVSVIDGRGAAVSVAGRLKAIEGRPKRLFVSLGRLAIVVYDRAAYGIVADRVCDGTRTSGGGVSRQPFGSAHGGCGDRGGRDGTHPPDQPPYTPTRRGTRQPCTPADLSTPPRTEPVMTQPDYPLAVLPSYDLHQVALSPPSWPIA